MKKIIFIISLVALFSSVQAENPTKSIIAIDYHDGAISQTFGNSATNDNHKIEKYGVKIGAVADLKRIFLSYRYETIENRLVDTKGYSFSIEYEGMATENGSGLFAGFIAGYGNYDFTGNDNLTRTQSGFFYGMDGGIALVAFDSFGFDVGVRYTLPVDTKNDDITSEIYKINDTTTTYISLNYLY